MTSNMDTPPTYASQHGAFSSAPPTIGYITIGTMTVPITSDVMNLSVQLIEIQNVVPQNTGGFVVTPAFVLLQLCPFNHQFPINCQCHHITWGSSLLMLKPSHQSFLDKTSNVGESKSCFIL
ncbi:hypothetical protein LIER_41585 [Lithospermum erythrorhizon]|uniref:Uncharacterized protein n=1 Tax=Lithospermum erythrorhizon TaxID=34254 RepID=A0AAV3RF13_LITER